MDLAIGAKQVFVVMELLTKAGQSKLVPQCTYPATGLRCLARVYTDRGILELRRDGARVAEMVEGMTIAELSKLTSLALQAA